MAEAVMTLILYLVALAGVNLLASWIVSRAHGLEEPPEDQAEFILALSFAIYAVVLATGTLGLFSPRGLAVAGLALLVLCRGEWGPLVVRWRALGKELAAACAAFPPLVVVVVFALAVQLASPLDGGDSLQYHLPNIWLLVKSGSTITYAPDSLFDPATMTAYYSKGMEAMNAFFYQFPLARITSVAFKWLLLAAFYLLVARTSRSRRTATVLVAFLLSTEVGLGDLGSLKNDLPLAIFVVMATTAVLERAAKRSAVFVAIALALALAMKANALLYVAPLGLLWLWRAGRRPVAVLALTAFVVVPFGLYFYAVNTWRLGSPIHPFGLSVAGHVILPGAASDAAGTSLLANLDAAMPVYLLRGALRQLGPVGLAGLAVALGVIARAVVTRRVAGIELALLGLWVLAYAATPFSDRNLPQPHSQLYSGHTLRMALPAILYAMVLAARALAPWVEHRLTPRSTWAVAAGLLMVANLVWYDIVSLWLKPANAFAGLASAVGSFDNRVLACVLVGGMALLAAVAWTRFRTAVAVLVLAVAVIVQVRRGPESLAQTWRFKQLGETTAALSVLSGAPFAGRAVAVCSPRSASYFVGCANGVLMRDGMDVHFVSSPEQAVGCDALVVCASDEQSIGDLVGGRTYRASLEFFNPARVPADFREVFADRFYRIYLRVGRREDGVPVTAASWAPT